MLLFFKDFRVSLALVLAKESSASMHSVGTKMGTVVDAKLVED
jgi:hypothetical protein